MKLIKTEEAVGHVLCHDMTQIIKDEYKDARFRKGHVVTEEDIPVLLTLVMALSLVACGNKTDDTQKTDDQTPAETVELTVFAATVSEGTVDCGIIYASDAYSVGLTVAATATAEMCGQVIYPAAVLNTSAHQEAAAAFLAYLQGAEASAEFEAVLFTPLSK